MYYNLKILLKKEQKYVPKAHQPPIISTFVAFTIRTVSSE